MSYTQLRTEEFGVREPSNSAIPELQVTEEQGRCWLAWKWHGKQWGCWNFSLTPCPPAAEQCPPWPHTLFWSHLPESALVGFGCPCLFTKVPSWWGLVLAASCLLILVWPQGRAAWVAEDQGAGLILSRILPLSLHHHISHSTHLWAWPWSCTKARCSLLHAKRTSQISLQKRREGGPWSWNTRKEKHKHSLKLPNNGGKKMAIRS